MLLEKGRGGFREGYFCLPKCGFYDPSLSWMLSETPLLKANCLSRCSVLSNFGEKHLYIKPKGKPHQSHQQLDIPPVPTQDPPSFQHQGIKQEISPTC